jgi:hypothetical protein
VWLALLTRVRDRSRSSWTRTSEESNPTGEVLAVPLLADKNNQKLEQLHSRSRLVDT